VDTLSRTSSPVPEALWQQIDAAAVSVARSVLTGRRILHLVGPLGVGVNTITIDDADAKAEVETDGILTTAGRKLAEIPTLFADFTLFARDLAQSDTAGQPADLSAAQAAAQIVALREDRLIFLGNEKLGFEGLLTAKGVQKLTRGDWSIGENAFTDVAAAIEAMVAQGVFGAYTLVVSPTLHTQLQRLQPAMGMLELDRVSKLVDGRLYKSPVLGKEQAVLLCAQPENMDLVVGQDLAAAYLEQQGLNHLFRLTETALPRLKRRKAVVVFTK
jgi:uncharacterized linocin/CFP29 family protein